MRLCRHPGVSDAAAGDTHQRHLPRPDRDPPRAGQRGSLAGLRCRLPGRRGRGGVHADGSGVSAAVPVQRRRGRRQRGDADHRRRLHECGDHRGLPCGHRRRQFLDGPLLTPGARPGPVTAGLLPTPARSGPDPPALRSVYPRSHAETHQAPYTGRPCDREGHPPRQLHARPADPHRVRWAAPEPDLRADPAVQPAGAGDGDDYHQLSGRVLGHVERGAAGGLGLDPGRDHHRHAVPLTARPRGRPDCGRVITRL